jgi:hypothetical protein
VKYKLGFYISEDDILDSHCRENLKSFLALTVKYELGFYTSEDGILHRHRRGHFKSYSYIALTGWAL